jgi:hypothetical protein
MTILYSPFAVAAFLGAVIAVHVIYFYACFPGDCRLRIKLSLRLNSGIDHRAVFPAFQGKLPFEPHAPSFSVLAGDVQGPLSDAEQFGIGLVIEERYLVLEGEVVDTPLVCCGDVEIRPGAVIGSNIKVWGNLDVGANVTFLGSVVVNGNIRTGENCHFLLEVVTRGRMAAGKGTLFAQMTDELLQSTARRRPAAAPASLARMTLPA